MLTPAEPAEEARRASKLPLAYLFKVPRFQRALHASSSGRGALLKASEGFLIGPEPEMRFPLKGKIALARTPESGPQGPGPRSGEALPPP